MKKSIIYLLKKNYSDVYFVDYTEKSCEVLTSSVIKTEDEKLKLDAFITMILKAVLPEYHNEITAFMDPSKLRSEFIKGKDYDTYFEMQNELYHAVMHPETGETGIIYIKNVRRELAEILGDETIGKAAGIMRITRQAAMNIMYVDDLFQTYTGLSKDAIADQYKNTVLRIVKDDLHMLLSEYIENENQGITQLRLRVKTKDAGVKWTDCHVISNHNSFDLVFIDAAHKLQSEIQQKTYDQLRNLLIEENNNQYFIYNVSNNILSVTDLKEKRQFVIKDFLQNIENWNKIHEEDRRALGLAFSAIMRGSKENDEVLCRTDFAGENYLESRIVLKAIRDLDGQLHKIIGTVN